MPRSTCNPLMSSVNCKSWKQYKNRRANHKLSAAHTLAKSNLLQVASCQPPPRPSTARRQWQQLFQRFMPVPPACLILPQFHVVLPGRFLFVSRSGGLPRRVRGIRKLGSAWGCRAGGKPEACETHGKLPSACGERSLTHCPIACLSWALLALQTVTCNALAVLRTVRTLF